jgi:ubiquinone/menaquinone biosynthesis C-methylase UbiE
MLSGNRSLLWTAGPTRRLCQTETMIKNAGKITLDLCCPQCGIPFRSEQTQQTGEYLDYDVLTCQCSSYPVVAGIVILQKGAVGATQQTDVEVMELIRKGRPAEALLAMLVPPPPAESSLVRPWMNRLPRRLRTRVSSYYVRCRGLPEWEAEAREVLTAPERKETASEFLEFYLHSIHRGQPSYASAFNYMVYRYGMPRHLSTLSLVSLFQDPAGPILELGCGCGHITRSWVDRAAGQPVVAIDSCFWALLVARNWMAPEAHYLCCEADRSLPFVNRKFAVISSSDAFHYFRDKAGSIREFQRVMMPEGAICLTGIGNAACAANAGTHYRLLPSGYQRLAGTLPHRLISDSTTLDRYLRKQGPALERSGDPEILRREPLVSLLITMQESLFRDHDRFPDWPHAEGTLQLNPLFVPVSRNDDSVSFRRQYPSQRYATDNPDFERYLPETAEMTCQQLADLATGKRTEDMEPLISRCVLLGMPKRFRPKTPATPPIPAAPVNERSRPGLLKGCQAAVGTVLALLGSGLYSWFDLLAASL